MRVSRYFGVLFLCVVGFIVQQAPAKATAMSGCSTQFIGWEYDYTINCGYDRYIADFTGSCDENYGCDDAMWAAIGACGGDFGWVVFNFDCMDPQDPPTAFTFSCLNPMPCYFD